MTNDTQSAAVAVISPPRLPWHPTIGDRFGVDRAAWKALVEAVFPLAKTSDSVVLALSYCRARKLDPFKRVVHIVPIWDSEAGGYVETVWPGIAEHRTTAFRTGQYGGSDAATFGETITTTFAGTTKRGAVKAEVKFPAWCQITVYRLIGGQRVPIPGPRVHWLETYSKIGKTDVPNDRWQRAPFQMIEKCAEAAALRRAFPEELGDEATADEAGARLGDPMVDVTPPPRPTREDFIGNSAGAPALPDEDATGASDDGGPHVDPEKGAGASADTGPAPDPRDAMTDTEREAVEREADRMQRAAERGDDPPATLTIKATPVPLKKDGAPDWIKWHTSVAAAFKALPRDAETRARFLEAHDPALENYAAVSPQNAATLRAMIANAE